MQPNAYCQALRLPMVFEMKRAMEASRWMQQTPVTGEAGGPGGDSRLWPLPDTPDPGLQVP